MTVFRLNMLYNIALSWYYRRSFFEIHFLWLILHNGARCMNQWPLLQNLMINSCLSLEIFAELRKFLVNSIIHLFCIILKIFYLLQRKLYVDKFIDIILIDSLCFQELNSWDPLMSVVFCFTSELNLSCRVI